MSRKVNKAVILAGGLGTRLSEETGVRPKPMIEIGGRPILWHIMKMYAHFGLSDFIICLGYKGYIIKEYFQNYFLHMSDVTFDMSSNQTIIHNRRAERWKVTLIDTGADTMTGGRIKRVAPYVGQEHFCMTYGDGVSDIDIRQLLDFHASHERDATVTVVRPAGRFGVAEIEGDAVTSFREKATADTGWINAGFFVLSPKVFDLIDGDPTVWERGPLETLATSGQLAAFKHDGFWHPMDTVRDKQMLEQLWQDGSPPWRHWNEGL